MFFTVAILTVALGLSVNGGSIGPCDSTNKAYTDCIDGFLGLFSGMTNPDVTAVGNAVCSPTGRDAFVCFYDYMLQCAEEMKQYEGLVNIIDAEGGLDLFCELTIGECSHVQQCFGKIPDESQFEITPAQQAIMTNVNSANAYQVLPFFLTLMCGPMKEYILCFVDTLSDCPAVVQLLEQFVNQSSMLGNTSAVAMPSINSMADYMRHSCAFEKGFEGKADCATSALMEPTFSECFQSARSATQGKQTCASYDALRTCVRKEIEPRCGRDAAIFVATGMPLFYPDVPMGCEPVVGAATTMGTSGLTLLGGALMYLLGVYA